MPSFLSFLSVNELALLIGVLVVYYYSANSYARSFGG